MVSWNRDRDCKSTKYKSKPNIGRRQSWRKQWRRSNCTFHPHLLNVFLVFRSLCLTCWVINGVITLPMPTLPILSTTMLTNSKNTPGIQIICIKPRSSLLFCSETDHCKYIHQNYRNYFTKFNNKRRISTRRQQSQHDHWESPAADSKRCCWIIFIIRTILCYL